MSEDIRFYCGIGEKDFNHHPIVAGPYACIAPVCGRGGIVKDKDGQPKLDRHGEPVQSKQAHIFGVCFAEALGPLLFQCDHTQQANGSWQLDEKHRVQLSTDSVGPTTRVTLTLTDKPGFSSWGYASWYEARSVPHVLDSCKVKDADGRKTPTCSPDTYCRGLQRAKHVQATIDWLANFRQRESRLYAPPTTAEYQQMSLFGVEQAS